MKDRLHVLKCKYSAAQQMKSNTPVCTHYETGIMIQFSNFPTIKFNNCTFSNIDIIIVVVVVPSKKLIIKKRKGKKGGS